MKTLTDSYVLRNGVKIPCIGFGTWKVEDPELAYTSVRLAIDAGYRHIDTAAIYRNEESVGRAIRESGIPRDELFVTTKLWNSDHSYQKALAAYDVSLNKLGLDYVDLYLIHWPNPAALRDRWKEENTGVWKAFEELYRAKRVRAIGVSNFRAHHLEELSRTSEITPFVNQVRQCPGDYQQEIADYCRKHDILIEAYSPLGGGAILSDPTLLKLSEKYHKNVAQLAVRWCLQKGFLPLPKSVTPSRIRENAEVFDFEISGDDIEAISQIQGICKYYWDPDKVTW